MGKFWKKVYEKFGKGIKFALSLHPLKRNEGGETRGRRVHVVAAFWRCWRRSFPADPLNGGARKKVWKNFGKDLEGMIKTPYLCTRFRERARGKKVKRGDWKKVWKKSLKSLENEKQALPLQPLSRGGHEGMTGATRWKKEFFKILRWTKRSERESESTVVEIRWTHDPAR